jgi:phage terminase small subunit
MSLKRLSLKQKNFAKEYINHQGNATEAALEAYNVNGTDSAEVIGSHNLDNPLIINEINKLLSQQGMNDDQWIAKNIKTAVETGIGVKATNKDAITVLNMLLKLKNYYPSNKNTSVKLSLHGKLTGKNVTDIMETVKKLNNRSNTLVNEL